jgi:chromosome segregation ATPase
LDQARTAIERQRDELKQKFELALEDVQRFRARVTELEQDLARRPEASQADSAELIALRAERDALAERVEVLERQPVGPIDASSEEQIADLQRRFELAVEDVRELKTKNAELESRLSAAKRSGGGHADAGGMDWESQKRRMLASLEGEGDGEVDEARQKERATIENTIEMTDAVVAEKDREIQELLAKLAEASSEKPEVDHRQQQINVLLNADEVIAEHRKRISQLEHEMEDKLRAAELELSVERAKIARERSELEELRIDLESRRKSHDSGASGGGPRRRWLSKLGLSGDEQSR